LAEERNIPLHNRKKRNLPDDAPLLTEEKIENYIIAHLLETGFWPVTKTGPILYDLAYMSQKDEEEGTEVSIIKIEIPYTWGDIDRALKRGLYGLEGGKSLFQIKKALSKEFGIPLYKTPKRVQNLSIEEIEEAIAEYYLEHGKRPHAESGKITDKACHGETWRALDHALKGGRGLPGGESLAKLSKSVVDDIENPMPLCWIGAKDENHEVLQHQKRYNVPPATALALEAA
jgi:hypothetical protein